MTDGLSTPCVLVVGGSDSGGGAGVQADARTIHALGGYASAAITAVTAQNGRGVAAWRAMPARLVARQMEAVFAGCEVAAVKTGLLTGAGVVRAVAAALAWRPDAPLVIDPLIASTSGTRFLSRAGVAALRLELLPRAALVTPNWAEAAELSGLPVRTRAEAERAARSLLRAGCRAVLVKGG